MLRACGSEVENDPAAAKKERRACLKLELKKSQMAQKPILRGDLSSIQTAAVFDQFYYIYIIKKLSGQV